MSKHLCPSSKIETEVFGQDVLPLSFLTRATAAALETLMLVGLPMSIPADHIRTVVNPPLDPGMNLIALMSDHRQYCSMTDSGTARPVSSM